MIDMAVGIVVGGAFKGIIDSLVKDIIMPPIGMLIGGVDFSALKAVLKPAEGEIAEVAINYGMFINTIIRSEERRVGKEGRSRGPPDH